jgi:hypothetical protein
MFRFSIFVLSIMIKSQYLKFYNHFGKFREPPVEGVWGKNSENGEGANGSLPFFVWDEKKMKSFGDVRVLNGANLRLEKGVVYTLKGEL